MTWESKLKLGYKTYQKLSLYLSFSVVGSIPELGLGDPGSNPGLGAFYCEALHHMFTSLELDLLGYKTSRRY